jgi:hypothetical protein
MIPLPYKLGAILLVVVAAFTFGYMKGNARAEVELQKFAAESQEKIAELEAVNSEIKETVITKFVDKVRTVKEKEYVYVQQTKDVVPGQFELSNGWVYLHDSSATDGYAEPAKSSDGTSSGLKDNQVLATIVNNYAVCHTNAQQLVQLQQWIRENQAAVNEVNGKNKK